MILALGITALSLWWHRPTTVPESLVHLPRQIPQNGSALLALGKKISINQASAEDLMALPGIGPERAASIIAWRAHHGPFTQIEDLKKVPGIGSQAFKGIRSSVEISDHSQAVNK